MKSLLMVLIAIAIYLVAVAAYSIMPPEMALVVRGIACLVAGYFMGVAVRDWLGI